MEENMKNELPNFTSYGNYSYLELRLKKAWALIQQVWSYISITYVHMDEGLIK